MGGVLSFPLVWWFAGLPAAVVYTAVYYVAPSPWSWLATLTIPFVAPNAPTYVHLAAYFGVFRGITKQLGLRYQLN